MKNSVKQNSYFTSIAKVKGGYSLTLTQVVVNENASLNVLALMNASDDRFKESQPKSRQCFLFGQASDIKKLYGIDVDALVFTENAKGVLTAPLHIENPELMGYQLQIELKDSFTPVNGFSPKQVTNKEGQILVFHKAGRPIYQSCLPSTNPKHDIWESDERVVYTQAQIDSLIQVNREAAEAKAAAKAVAGPKLVA